MTDPVVRLILDTSAVLAYANSRIEVGETISEVVEEGSAFGASVVSLAEAMRMADKPERDGIRLLAAHVCFKPLPAKAGDWQRLGYWAANLGTVQHAAAIIEAIDRDGYVITAEPHSYGENLPVITF